MTSSHLCTNCTTPRTSGQDICSYCGHDSRNDAALLGPPLAMTASAALSIPGLDPLALAAWEDPSSSSSALMGGTGAEGQRSPSPVRVPMVATAKLDERMLLHRPSLTPHPERCEPRQYLLWTHESTRPAPDLYIHQAVASFCKTCNSLAMSPVLHSEKP